MIEFHADDYGLFPKQSERILYCAQNGVLNGVSIMANSPYLDECMQKISSNDGMKIAVHLNLVEGKCLSEPSRIPLLVDREGGFRISFGKLLLVSVFAHKKKLYTAQIKEEFRCQIRKAIPYFKGSLRLDSHVHYHMIPVVFDALIELIEEENWNVEYIRIPKEKISLYTPVGDFSGFKLINFIKVLVLNVLAFRNERKHRAFLGGMDRAICCGVVFSGNMCYENVTQLLSNLRCAQDGKNVELIFHPGGVLETEDADLLTSQDDKVFLTAPSRRKEADALIFLRDLGEL